MNKVELIEPGSFEAADHWYPSAFNATVHPMVAYFMNLSQDQICSRYCHLHPAVSESDVRAVLDHKPRFFLHSGTDLIHATNESGHRQMVVIETNSSPSGQKSMPLVDDFDEFGGYRKYVRETMVPAMKGRRKVDGALGVLYDKNYMEASGYAATMAEEFGEPVYLIPCFDDTEDLKHIRAEDDVLFVRPDGSDWLPLRAVFRYVTQRPWNRLPMIGKTFIFNPVIICLAGGRNKLVASKAYEWFNAENKDKGLAIYTPETIWDVDKNEIPFWLERMGGKAVVKIPYSNAGQGVFTIVNQEELDNFMALEFDYEKFVVQALIGNHKWSSDFTGGKKYHVGTVPNKKMETFALDFRMLVHWTKAGFRPMGAYARRAAKPLKDTLVEGSDSWDMLGTNLSVKEGDNKWSSDTHRLLLMDRKGFNRLGVGLDDLIDGYIQSVMATVAIDNMAQSLVSSKQTFKTRLFKSLNNDASLINELY